MKFEISVDIPIIPGTDLDILTVRDLKLILPRIIKRSLDFEFLSTPERRGLQYLYKSLTDT